MYAKNNHFTFFILLILCFIFSLFFFYSVSDLDDSKVPVDLLDISFVPDSLIFQSLDEFGGFFYFDNYGLTHTNVTLNYELISGNGTSILNYSNRLLIITSLEFYDSFPKFKNLSLEGGFYTFSFSSEFTGYKDEYIYIFS